MKKEFLILLFITLAGRISFAQESNQKALNVTVYNSDLGVIRDVRTFDIKSGTSQLKVTDVAQMIDPTSVHIKLNGNVIEQNYQYDLVNMEKILEKYIDREITITGDKGIYSGTLLSTNSNQIVLKSKDGGLLMLPDINKYQIAVGTLPEGLITKPTLVWTINSSKGGKQDVELSYQTSGMNWHAEYVAVLNENDTKLDLNSWVSIDNHSGASYDNAVLKLIAGDVNRIQQPMPREITFKNRALDEAAGRPQFEERAFFEYHIYDLQRPATLANNETKQISLFEAKDVNITKKYLYRSGGYYYPYVNTDGNKVAVAVEFDNKKGNNLGMPMPAGKVRIYKTDEKTIEFVGEDMLNHTPKDETIRLKVGNAFDIIAEEKMVDQKSLSDKIREEAYEIKFRNRKTESITIDVERFLGTNWEILDSNFKWEKKNAQTITFRVPVNKDGEEILKFRVRYSY